MAINVHFVTGSKGNVGKTAWSEAMVAYYEKQGKKLVLIDGDKDVPALSKTCSTEQIAFSDDPGLSTQPDAILKLAYAESKLDGGADILVDLPAGGESSLNNWIDASSLNRLGKTYGFNLIKWWLSDSDRDSIQLFRESAEKYPKIRHIFIKNMGKSRQEQWDDFDKDTELAKLVKKNKGAIISIPYVEPVIIDFLRANSIQLTDVIKDKEFHITDIAANFRVDTWVEITKDLISSVMQCDTKEGGAKTQIRKEESSNYQEAVATK